MEGKKKKEGKEFDVITFSRLAFFTIILSSAPPQLFLPSFLDKGERCEGGGEGPEERELTRSDI